jgi:hypothetical protein
VGKKLNGAVPDPVEVSVGTAEVEVPRNLTVEELKGLIETPAPEVVFSDVEREILSNAMMEAQQSIQEHQKMQEMVQQRRDVMLGLTKAADKVYRTVMILKGVNPDAYQMAWNPSTNEVVLNKK